ncbi:hypothetical protein DSO57_1016018 [Entomophthora muscae]|uniref:Uncharacterized protein n=1 Tax=Entomophthora muscae TaxID=34485 RepID=A0ACC2TGU3_9FUNG|nr:hypothetical protein DSO57_1016018 [Entomophthora muscae]
MIDSGNLFPVVVSSLPFTTVKGLENPTPTINWQNSLANGWFKYPSGHWGRKFHYGRQSTPPPAEPSLVRHHASFYLLMYMVGYYLLGCFSSLMGRFTYLGHLGHLAMVTVPIGSAIAGLNLGALAHQLGNLFPAKWVPDTILGRPNFRIWDQAGKAHNRMGANLKMYTIDLQNQDRPQEL